MEHQRFGKRGKGEKKRAVRHLVEEHKPAFLFLQETKLSAFDSRLSVLEGSFLNRGLVVDAVGALGGGDFNVVLAQSERIGECSNRRSIRNFNSFLNEAKLVDIPLIGMTITWTKSRERTAWARLDQFLFSPEFLAWYPSLVQKGLGRSVSDHNAICIGESKVNWGPIPFLFFNWWLEEKGLMQAAVKVQGLSNLLSKAVNMGFIMGEKFGRRGVNVSHLQFVDDTIVFLQLRMPVGVAQKIEKLQRCFLWGDEIEKRKLHAVDWIMVCKSKKNGGSRIGRILDKNEGLLSKWLWRFGTDGSSLWKKVVCDKYGVDGNRLLWDWKTVSAPSFFVKAVANVIRLGSRPASVFVKGVQVVVGNRTNIMLWQDVMVESHHLKVPFPRMYALAVNKIGFISDFGQWQNQKWVWKVELRRPPFD
ncbi:hypothetical protein Ddye_005719 [Dipteronia dyeriana]|uniref:Uncharacterized protein n=1 Tax=Dipteronia dyeriana TaxID=168575 RepID=A0AAE0CQ05_9ROSI|nr:hypothetical protein Ddye_005719 [Dipteronia dyeriana]